MTGEAAFRNRFIRCQAKYQTLLATYEEEKKKNKYDVGLLLQAEDCLKRSRVIAMEQYSQFKSLDFKSWMRNERWTYGGKTLLIAYHKQLNRVADVALIEAYSEDWCSMVENLDGFCREVQWTKEGRSFAASELEKVQKAYAEQIKKLKEELEKLEGKEDIVKNLREDSREARSKG